MKQQTAEQAGGTQIQQELIIEGIKSAVSGLSQMINKDFIIKDFAVNKVLAKDVPYLFGGPEAVLVGVYLGVKGYADGHMIVAYQPEVAFNLVDMLLDQPISSTKDLMEMEQSALGEVGNIMGSLFLTHISDQIGISYRVSPPAVIMDMAGAVLEVALASILEKGEYTYIINATFELADRTVSGMFLILPIPELPNNHSRV